MLFLFSLHGWHIRKQQKIQTSIDEKIKELESNVLYGVVGDVFKDVVSGKISPEQLEKL